MPAANFPGSGAAGANLGIQPFYGVETIQLAPEVTATVNLATGNLVLRSQDVRFNAPGLSLHLDSFHNSRAAGQGGLGVGAVLSTGQDVGLQITSSTVTFYGPSGFTATYTANGAGGWTAPPGINADLVHNADGSWSLTYHKNGERLSFTAGGYLIGDVDRNGVGLALDYNTDNKVDSITDGAGRVTTFTYQAQGNISKITDPTGRVVDYDYDNNRADPANNTYTINAVHYPDGSTLGFTATADGKVHRLQTRNGNYVDFKYDSNGRITDLVRYTTAGATSGDDAETEFAYPSATTTTETSPIGGTSTYTLDSLGRVTSVTDPLNHTRSQTWTANSDVLSATDAMGSGGTGGNTTSYSYDAINNLTAVALPTGAATRAAYAQGTSCSTTDTGHPYQAKCTTDDAGHPKALTYDTPGNVTSVTDTTPGGGAAQQTFTYQSAGTGGTQCGGKPGQICTATDGNGHTTSYAYDSNGNLTTVTPPAPQAATSYGYDDASRLTSVTDGLGQTTSYTYDAADRLTSTTYDSGAEITYFYDDDGNLTSTIDTTKGNSTYTYDTLGREISRTQPGMSSPWTTGYDKAGNVTAVSDTQGQMVYAYNTANQLTQITEPVNRISTFGYDANGNETTRTLSNTVVQTTTRDNDGRPTRIRAVNGAGTVLSDLSYSYTAAGGSGPSADRSLVQSRTDNLGVGGPAGSTISYGYDSLSRLIAATEKTSAGAVNASWAYTYDKVGNRTTQTLTGATGPGTTATSPAATTTWGYNADDELTSRNGDTTGWSYDANGNQLNSPDWGSARYGVRSSVRDITTPDNVQTAFEYLGGGNTTRLDAGSTSYINGSLGLASQTDTLTTNYRRTPDGRIFSSYNSNGTRRYYLTDAQGSVVALTSTNAGNLTASYAYDPYGNTRTATGTDAATNPIRYTGGCLDTPTGLYHLAARYYDPTTARFTQMDPSGQEANPYLYAGGNPINHVDPSGECSLLDCITHPFVRGAEIGGTVGVAAAAVGCAVAGGPFDLPGCAEVGGMAGAVGAAAGFFFGFGFGIGEDIVGRTL